MSFPRALTLATNAAREALIAPYSLTNTKMPSVLAAVKGWVLAMLGLACAWLRFPGSPAFDLRCARWPA